MTSLNTPLKNDVDDEESKEAITKHVKQETTTFTQQNKDAWLNFDIDLTEIDTKNQTFSIHVRINVFWLDQEFIDTIFKQKKNDNDNDDKDTQWKQQNSYIHSYSYEDFISDFPSYRLPLNLNKLFCNIYETEKEPKESWRIWINPQTKDLHIFLEFKGKLIEHLECDDFPYDAQFLNIQLFYDSRNYSFTSQCPDYVYLASPFAYQLPIKVTKFNSIVQWKLLSPWIDLSKKKQFFYENGEATFEPNFGLIKLRVQRDPNYYLLYMVFPLMLITLASFAVTSIPPEDIGDRLGYLVTLLLTVAAFQYAISATLPESPTLTNVDKFILSGYLIECLFILYVSISVELIEYEGMNETAEKVLGAFLGFCWLFCVVLFVIYPYCKYQAGVDWKRMSDNEYHELDTQNMKNSNVHYMEEGDIFFGSNDGGEIKGQQELRCLYMDERLKSGKRLLDIKTIDAETYTEAEKKWKDYQINNDKYKGQLVPKPYQKTILLTGTVTV